MAKRAQPKYVVLGAGGQLGQAFLHALGARAVGLERAQLELGDAAALERTLDALEPEVVINTAAFNHVDLAETQRQRALAANFLGPAQLAGLAQARGWRLLHFSTDYVFGGDGGGDGLARPRVESDAPAPVNFYGYSKLLGEEAVLRDDPTALVARVAHLYGGQSLSPGRANLVQRFLEQARAGQPLWVTRGQTLNPTSVRDLAPAALALLESGARGLFHLTGEGECGAEEFAREVLRLARLEAEVRVVERDIRPAPRALYTVLENRRLADEGFAPLPHWRDSLAACVAALCPRSAAPAWGLGPPSRREHKRDARRSRAGARANHS
ncbi:MAG TPA: NAD(P)-dependent oxidoreductase [Terriglobales bacterium]|nr:NAD(P)-dependent oxidoreductase [Terriglobales bacterium]